MSDTTKKPPKNQQSIDDPHYDSLAFGCLSPVAYKRMLDMIPFIGGVLGWSQLSIWFLQQIIRLMPASGTFTRSHLKFARKFWVEITEDAARRRIRRYVSALIKDMMLSGFQAVRIQRGDKFKENGKERWLPTVYTLGDFFVVYAEIQGEVLKCDLFRLSEDEQRARLMTITEGVLRSRSYQSIPPRARQQPKQSATKSEAAGAASAKVIAESRKPNENFNDDLDWFSDRIYQHLIECGKVDAEFRYRVKRVFHALEIAELRALETLDLHRRSKLELVGG